MTDAQLFDLNTQNVLEAWDTSHAVRELIANALDEQILTGTADVQIAKDKQGRWTIRDFGRGLLPQHFAQNENPEKVEAIGRVIGKFGVGLKDAMATLDREGIEVEIESAHCVVTLKSTGKAGGFADIITLHAAVYPARDPAFVGTAVRLRGLRDDRMELAKSYFLRFTGDRVLERTPVGCILERRGMTSRIYVAGLVVAEEERFAFSYDITTLNAAMRKQLNRERTNVGRTAYTERVKAMLLEAKSDPVVDTLAIEVQKLADGDAAEEVKWKDITLHACKLLNARGGYLFVTADERTGWASQIDHALNEGLQLVTVPSDIREELRDVRDLSGAPVRDLSTFQEERAATFRFEWINPEEMTAGERETFALTERIAALAGGMPKHVRAVRVSATMRPDPGRGDDVLGLWDGETNSIVIRRDQLANVSDYAGTLLHEIAHARSGQPDVSRGFEDELTELLGSAASAAVRALR